MFLGTHKINALATILTATNEANEAASLHDRLHTFMSLMAVRPPGKLAPKLLSPGTFADDFSSVVGAAAAAETTSLLWKDLQRRWAEKEGEFC